MRKIFLFIPFFSLLWQYALAQPRRFHVSSTAAGTATGTTWPNAFPNLQTALKTAKAGDSIWVAAGIYKPTAGTDRGTSFEPPSGVLLYGGFRGDETTLAQRNPGLYPTILSGDIGRPNDSTDNSYNIVYLHEPDSNTTLDGVVFQYGNADYTGFTASQYDRRKCGGGLYIMGADADAYPNIVGCIFEHNHALNAGGGAVVNGTGDGSVAPRFVRCRFEDNRVSLGSGGGLAKAGGSWAERGTDLEGCAFRGNYANNRGGAFYFTDSERTDTLSIDRCTFERNEAGQEGSALFLGMGRANPNGFSMRRSQFLENRGGLQANIVRFAALGIEGYLKKITIDSCNFVKNFRSDVTVSAGEFRKNLIAVEMLALDTAYSSISNCVFEDNKNFSNLIAYAWEGSNAEMKHVKVTENKSKISMFFYGGANQTRLENIVIFNNVSLLSILYQTSTKEATHANIIFSENYANQIFQGTANVIAFDLKNTSFVKNHITPTSSLPNPIFKKITAQNCLFYKTGDPRFFLYAPNGTNVSHSYFDTPKCPEDPVWVPFTCGPGNLFGIPPQFRDTTNHDYRLLPCSPLVDAGDNAGVSATDLDGKPRIQGQRVDIGAYETSGLGWATAPQARASCPDTATGGFLLRPDNGCPPYQIQWRNGNLTGSDTTDLAPGTYVLTLTDGRGQTLLDTLEIAAPPAPRPVVATTPVQCGLALGGSATASSADGVPPLRFNWNNGLSGASLAGLVPGAYTVTATDARGCSGTATATVGRLGALALLVGGSPISCAGRTDGRLSVTPFGGKPPFRYDWNQGGTDSLLTGLPPGPYTVTVSDAFGCSGAFSFSLNEPDPLRAVATAQDATASNAPDGQAAVSGVTGGTSPYRYHWSTAASTEVIAMLLPGTYTVTVTDHRGCTDVQTVVVKFLNATGETKGAATLVFFPNPAVETVTVAAHWPSQPQNPHLRLFDASGRLVLDTPLPNAVQGDAFAGHVPLEGLPAGVYTAVLLDGVGRVWGKGTLAK